jgi:TolB-like protein
MTCGSRAGRLALAGGAFLALGLLAGSPAGGQEADRPTLAVLDLNDGGSIGPDAQDISNLGTGLAMMLTTEMLRNPRVDMVERDQIKELIGEQGLALSGMVDPSTAIEVGQLVGANYMLFGTYTDVLAQLRVDVRVVDVQSGRLLRAREVTKKREEVFQIVTELAVELFDDLELSPPQKLPERKEIPARAVILFSQAVGREDRGDVEGARAKYREALEVFPEYEEARARLARLDEGGQE